MQSKIYSSFVAAKGPFRDISNLYAARKKVQTDKQSRQTTLTQLVGAMQVSKSH
jgi:hypothetical protein